MREYSDYVLGVRAAAEAAPIVEVKPYEKEQPSASTAAKPAAKPTTKPAAKAAAKTAAKQEQKLYDPRLYAAAKAVIEDDAKRPATPKEEPKQAVRTLTGRTIYTVQVMASRKPLSLNSAEFKEYRGRVHQYESNGDYRYKYGVGKYKDRNEALAAAAVVRKVFPSAFIVAIDEGATAVAKKR